MKVKDILSRVTTRYNDKDYTRVDQSMYLMFLDDAISQLIMARPDAHVKTSIEQLVAGTRQTLPADGLNLIAIYRNMTRVGADFVEGSPILQVEREQLDVFSNWHDGAATDQVDEYAYDERSPKTYWVSKPIDSHAVVYVEMDYSYPLDKFSYLTDDFDTILEMDVPLEDVFINPLVAYMLHLLYSTDSGSELDVTLSQRYEQVFYQSLGLEYKAKQLVKPKVELTENSNAALT